MAGALPTRGTGLSSGGSVSDDEAIPDADPSNTAGILLERLQAWKHACADIEDYISATEKMQRAHAKEYEKVLKTISKPLREGNHFDQSLGGIAGLLENMRTNTQAISDSHLETSKAIHASVLPILAQIHSEIKSKSKELANGAAKGAKSVDKARNTTQGHIELLGQHSGAFESAGSKIEPQNDPYVLQRRIQYHLHRQVLEENSNRHDLIAVQDDFASFEAHIVRTFQQAMGALSLQVGGQADRQKALYTDMTSTCQRIPLEFEWMNFLHRSGNLMVDPSTPNRDVSSITYPNQDHQSTKPLIAGTLQRKSRAMGGLSGYKSAYYVVTRSKYLHQFADDDNFKRDPTPDLSLYLPECTVGALAGEKFNIKGKDSSGGKIGSALAMSHEIAFKADDAHDAKMWWSIISDATGSSNVTADVPSPDSSPVATKSPALPERKTQALQTQDLPAGAAAASAESKSAGPVPQSAGTAPNSAAPQSAHPQHAEVAPHSAGGDASSAIAAPQHATATQNTAVAPGSTTAQTSGVVEHAPTPEGPTVPSQQATAP